MAKLDYGLYPSREMQMEWLKVYLQAYKLFTKKTEEVSQRELETLYVQVNKFALVRRNMLTHARKQMTICYVLTQGFILL